MWIKKVFILYFHAYRRKTPAHWRRIYLQVLPCLSRIEELEGLNQKHIKALQKTYHVLSIIGSQSSGKSTLLNALFGTTFEELNRKKRVGQTTKGIWYSMNTADSMMIVDVEGSDSNEREERTVKSSII